MIRLMKWIVKAKSGTSLLLAINKRIGMTLRGDMSLCSNRRLIGCY